LTSAVLISAPARLKDILIVATCNAAAVFCRSRFYPLRYFAFFDNRQKIVSIFISVSLFENDI
jgi:hypothetical protein